MDQCPFVALSDQCNDTHCDKYACPSHNDRRVRTGESWLPAFRSGDFHWNIWRVRAEEAMAGSCTRRYLLCNWDAVIKHPSIRMRRRMQGKRGVP